MRDRPEIRVTIELCDRFYTCPDPHAIVTIHKSSNTWSIDIGANHTRRILDDKHEVLTDPSVVSHIVREYRRLCVSMLFEYFLRKQHHVFSFPRLVKKDLDTVYSDTFFLKKAIGDCANIYD